MISFASFRAGIRLATILLLARPALAAAVTEIDSTTSAQLVAPADPLRYYDVSGEGIRLFHENKLRDAEPRLEEAVRDYPLDGRNWFYLGLTRHSLRKFEAAIAAYERARQLRSRVAYWFLDDALAQAHLAAGDKQGAYRALERLVFEDG